MPLDVESLDIHLIDEVQAYVKDLNPMNWWEKDFYFRILIGGEIHWLGPEQEKDVEQLLKKLTNVNWQQIELAKKAESDNEAGCFTIWKKS